MERILCSAIKRIEPRERCNYYQNDIHLIEIGYRHHDILIRFKGEVSEKPEDQGFYTSFGRFVDRHEACKIAKIAGQIEVDDKKTVLYSEDLY